MGLWGQMGCTVTNQTGGTITNVSVLHQWSSYQDSPNPNPTPSLGSNDEIQFQINVGSGGSDDWSVTFTDSSGQCWYRNGKQCDVEDSDYKSGSPVNINLLAGSQGFSIEMPSSSSCTDNSYDKCPG